MVFIAHEQTNSQTGYVTPKGDKRCMNPIIDKCDYVVYLKSNGVDGEGRVIKSSAYLAQTNEFFARARIEYTPTFIKEFTAENLTAAIQEGIDKKRALDNATVTTFAEQQQLNEVEELDFDALIHEFQSIVANIPGSSGIDDGSEESLQFKNYWAPKIVQLTEKHLGKGKKISQCTPNQVEAISLIVDELKEIVNGH